MPPGARPVRQLDVEQHQVGHARGQPGMAAGGALGLVEREAGHPQHPSEQVARRVVVIDDQDMRSERQHAYIRGGMHPATHDKQPAKLSGGQRNREAEGGAAADLGVHRDLSAVRLHDAFDDREAEPRAGAVGPTHAPIAVEDVWEVLGACRPSG